MKQLTLQEKCFVYLWYCVLAYMIEYPLVGSAILTRLIWIPALLYLGYACLKETILSPTEILGIAYLFFLMLIHMSLSGNLTSTHHWIACFCFIVQLLSAVRCSCDTISRRVFDHIYYIAVAIALLFSCYSLTSLAYKVTTHGRVWHTIYFVFNLDNSNIAGIYLLCILSILIINLSSRKHKIPLAVLICYVFYMIIKTNARSCIIAAIAVMLIHFLLPRSIPKWIIATLMIVPIVSAYVYMYLYRNIGGTFIFLGKDLFSGREDVFLEYLSKLSTRWDYIWGNFGANALQNAHNAPISIVSSVGVIGLIITYYIWWRSIGRISSRKTRLATTCVAVILGVFVETSAEATMLLGGFPGIVFLDSFILLANYDPEYESKLQN